MKYTIQHGMYLQGSAKKRFCATDQFRFGSHAARELRRYQ